jgi:hypothetical protein
MILSREPAREAGCLALLHRYGRGENPRGARRKRKNEEQGGEEKKGEKRKEEKQNERGTAGSKERCSEG